MSGWRQKSRSAIVVVAVVLVGVGLLAACDSGPDLTRQASEVWSRGLPLGTAILNNPVALQVDETGRSFVVWVGSEHTLRFVRLDEHAEVVVGRSLDLCCGSAHRPQLTRDPAGRLHLTWLEKSAQTNQLYYAQLDEQGQVVVPAKPLTGSGERVGYSLVVLNQPLGRLEVFWSDDRPSNPGVYHLALNLQGDVVATSASIIPEGLRPGGQVDNDGFVHLTWTEGPSTREVAVFYAVFDTTSRYLTERARVSSFVVAPGQVIHGPVMGIDLAYGYVIWAVESRARETMVSHAFFTVFPLGQLERQAMAEVQAPDENAPQYDPDRGQYNYYYTAPHQGGLGIEPISVADTDFLASPAVSAGQQPELAVTFNGRVYAQNADALQVVAMMFSGGRLVERQIVNDTSAASLQPNVAVDAAGYQHLAWIDTAGFHRYQVLYASTAPQIRETLDRVTVNDVVNGVLGLGFGALTMIGFLPLYVLWAIPAFLLLLVFFLVTQEADLAHKRAVIALAAAILLHVTVKVTTTGSLMARLDPGGLLVNPWIAAAIRWLAPVAVAAFAVAVMAVYIRRTRNQSLFVSFFVFVVADAVLFSLMTLGPLLLVG